MQVTFFQGLNELYKEQACKKVLSLKIDVPKNFVTDECIVWYTCMAQNVFSNIFKSQVCIFCCFEGVTVTLTAQIRVTSLDARKRNIDKLYRHILDPTTWTLPDMMLGMSHILFKMFHNIIIWKIILTLYNNISTVQVNFWCSSIVYICTGCYSIVN